MTSQDLMYVMTGLSPECAEVEPADEDTAPEPRELDSETALCEAIALIELLLVREQKKNADVREGYRFATHTLINLRKAQDALSQIIGRK